MSLVRPSVQPSCIAKKFSVGHHTQSSQSDSFVIAMLVGMIDFYSFLPL